MKMTVAREIQLNTEAMIALLDKHPSVMRDVREIAERTSLADPAFDDVFTFPVEEPLDRIAWKREVDIELIDYEELWQHVKRGDG